MTAHPEHDLQVKINQFVRENVPQPHFFFAVDRRQKSGAFSHVREKMRGHVSGTPDTVLLMPGLPAITIELKAKGEKPEPGGAQELVGGVIEASGHLWGWCDTVLGYYEMLRRFGVQMGNYAALRAEAHDRTLEGAAIKRKEAKTGKPAKGRVYRAAKPSLAKIRRVESIRKGVLF